MFFLIVLCVLRQGVSLNCELVNSTGIVQLAYSREPFSASHTLDCRCHGNSTHPWVWGPELWTSSLHCKPFIHEKPRLGHRGAHHCLPFHRGHCASL